MGWFFAVSVDPWFLEPHWEWHQLRWRKRTWLNLYQWQLLNVDTLAVSSNRLDFGSEKCRQWSQRILVRRSDLPGISKQAKMRIKVWLTQLSRRVFEDQPLKGQLSCERVNFKLLRSKLLGYWASSSANVNDLIGTYVVESCIIRITLSARLPKYKLFQATAFLSVRFS